MDSGPWLFQGELVNGRLSNEISLLRDCPVEFFEHKNPWTACMRQYLLWRDKGRRGALIPWQRQQFHVSELANGLEAKRREKVFEDMLDAKRSSLRLEQRAAILAWMLSEIVTTVPRYIPTRPPTHDH